jgi:diacylglycerol kinase family enzyme
VSVPEPRRPVLFVNPRSGGGRAERADVPRRARERGIDVVVVAPGQRLDELVDDAVASGADALGMAGGDGSMAVVATAALAHGLPFICVPAGTRNHFALDLGLDPQDLVGALDAFTDGMERRIDVGIVNGRVFLNNVSLGVYGDAVHQPEYRDAKVRTLLATARAQRGPSAETPGLHLVDDLGRDHANCAMVLVSNNPYSPGPRPARGSRPTLNGGRLGVIVVDARGTGAHPPARAWTATSVKVEAATTVHAGIDGEAVDLSPPLEFGSRPAALRVRVPPPRRGDHPERVMTAHPAGPETA